MIEAIAFNLQRGVKLLNAISDSEYADTSVAPYYSSIGGHIRHILDVFDCIFEGLPEGHVNLIKRKRNQMAESFTEYGLAYLQQVLTKLHNLQSEDFNRIVKVTDDLGLGEVTADYTLGAALIQAHSHAIHHFAIVGYIISRLKLQLPDDDFGMNPTSPKPIRS